MPSPLVIKLSQNLNISLDKVEAAWKKAKFTAAESLQKEVTNLAGDDFALVSTITKRMLGVKEKINIVAFLKSGKSAKDFVEDMVSTGAGIGHSLDTVVIPPKKKMAQPRDDEDLSGGSGMYSDSEDEDDAKPSPTKVVALGNTRKAIKQEEVDIYANHSRINLGDLAHQESGATERLAALAEQLTGSKTPDATQTTFTAPDSPPIRQERRIDSAPKTFENRSRLRLDDLEGLNQPLASVQDALGTPPSTIVSIIDERQAVPEADPLMDDFANDLAAMIENGVSED